MISVVSSRFGPGVKPQVVVGANPAANAELTQTVPTGEIWLVLSVTVALAQGATQTPQPILTITDGTTKFYESFGSSAAQAVSTTCQYTWSAGFTLSGQVGATTNVHSVAPLPVDLLLLPGYVISTTTLGLGANTDYAAPSFFVFKGSA